MSNLSPNQVHRNLALRACRKVLVPVARFLMHFGAGHKEFANIARLAFMDAAVGKLKEEGVSPTKSAISSLSGLSRRDVDRLIGSVHEAADLRDIRLPVSEVLNEWVTNSRYCDESGEPAVLPMSSTTEPSIEELVATFGQQEKLSDIVDFLVSSGSIRLGSDSTVRLRSRALIAKPESTYAIYHFERTMFTLGSTLIHNLESCGEDVRLFERSAFTYGIRELSLPKFFQLSRSVGEGFLEIFDEWLTANEDKERKITGGHVSGVCLFAFHATDNTALSPDEIARFT